MHEWNRWREHILSRLDKIDDHMQKNLKAHESMRVSIARLEVKISSSAKFYGFFGRFDPGTSFWDLFSDQIIFGIIVHNPPIQALIGKHAPRF